MSMILSIIGKMLAVLKSIIGDFKSIIGASLLIKNVAVPMSLCIMK